MRRAVIRACWAVLIVYWIGLFVLTHIPGTRLPPVRVSDKTLHTVSYAVLAAAMMVCLRVIGRLSAASAIAVLGIVLAYAAFDELTQALPFIHRSCELADWNADAAGAAVAVVIGSLAMKKRET